VFFKNYFFISPSYPPVVAPETISSLDFDYKAWNLPEAVLKVLPKEVATFVISGRFKKVHVVFLLELRWRICLISR
jgi:hypothetical protein